MGKKHIPSKGQKYSLDTDTERRQAAKPIYSEIKSSEERPDLNLITLLNIGPIMEGNKDILQH